MERRFQAWALVLGIMNQVELFFSIMQRMLLRNGEFDSVEDLTAKIINSSVTTTSEPNHSA